MKIFLVGEFLKGYLTLSYERYLKLCGCEVSRLDITHIISNSPLYFCNRNPLLRRLLARFWEHLINDRLIAGFNQIKPDLVLVFKGNYIWPKSIRTIGGSGKGLIFCFNADSPFNLISRGASNRNILNSIPYYDCYFIWSKSLVERIYKSGAKKVEYLPFGFDSTIHYPTEAPEYEKQKSGNDIVFVGDWDKERERWLKELVNFDVGIWGTDYWRTRCRDKNIQKNWHRTAMYEEDMRKALSAAKISLNILREQNKGAHNMRTFEAPACQAFALAERSAEAKEFFEEDKEAVYFSNPEELREKAAYYLRHEEERKKIAQAGYRRCMSSGYSYLDRVKKILKVYETIR